jgi:hypothetical protein
MYYNWSIIPPQVCKFHHILFYNQSVTPPPIFKIPLVCFMLKTCNKHVYLEAILVFCAQVNIFTSKFYMLWLTMLLEGIHPLYLKKILHLEHVDSVVTQLNWSFGIYIILGDLEFVLILKIIKLVLESEQHHLRDLFSSTSYLIAPYRCFTGFLVFFSLFF